MWRFLSYDVGGGFRRPWNDLSGEKLTRGLTDLVRGRGGNARICLTEDVPSPLGMICRGGRNRRGGVSLS